MIKTGKCTASKHGSSCVRGNKRIEWLGEVGDRQLFFLYLETPDSRRRQLFKTRKNILITLFRLARRR
jgi:hypothetical protein